MAYNKTIINAMIDEAKKMDRTPGYYWVRFPSQPDWWQPGSWDNNAKMWVLIGSNQPWYDFQLIEVGNMIDEYVQLTHDTVQ